MIERVFEAYAAAVLARDVEAFVSLYAAGVRVFDLWGWSSEGEAAQRKMAADWFGSLGTDSVKVSFEEIRTTVSGDLALAHAFTTYRGISAEGKELRSMQNRLTWGLQQQGGAWKIIHEHTSAPIGEDLKASLKRP